MKRYPLLLVVILASTSAGCRLMVQGDLCGAVPLGINEIRFASKHRHKISIPRAVPIAIDKNNIPIAPLANDTGQAGLGGKILRIFTFPFIFAAGFLIGALVVAVRVRAMLFPKAFSNFPIPERRKPR